MRRPPASAARSPARRAARPGRAQVGGAPLALPPWLDRCSDRWWGLDPRTRTLAVLAGVLLLVSATAIRTAASPYGPPVAVLVAAEDLAAGAQVDARDMRTVRWPADLVPSGHRTDPTGILTAPLPAGAVLTDAHVTDSGVGGLVAAGQHAVPLPAELVPALPVGTRVQVVATGVDGDAEVLAEDGDVVAHDDTTVWVAVPDGTAAAVASAGLRGSLAVAVRSSPAAVADVGGGPGLGSGG